jgi:N-glycosylase/DNA lyase
VLLSCDKWCVAEQNCDHVILHSHDLDYFEQYLDLHTDYDNIETYLSQYAELSLPIQHCKGLHILRQNLLETIVSFVVSANNNIRRIKNTLNCMCSKYGEHIFVVDRSDIQHEYCLFPSLDKLCDIDILDWRVFGAGYRANYLVETCHNVSKNNILQRLPNMSYDQAMDTLLSLKGVGDKVANCIALFGLHNCASFPVDTWIFKSLRTNTLDTKHKVYQYYTDRYGDYGGVAQQYIFYYNRTLSKLAI